MGNLLTYFVSREYYYLTKLLLILGYRYYNKSILLSALGNENMTKLLLSYGNSDINNYSYYIIWTISFGCTLNFFKFLKENNANTDTCLGAAINESNIDICKYLITVDNIIDQQYLFTACYNKKSEIIKLLIKYNINLNIKPDDITICMRKIENILQYFIFNSLYCTFISIDLKDKDSLKVFIENNVYDDHEYTMLYYASITENKEVVEFLLDHKEY